MKIPPVFWICCPFHYITLFSVHQTWEGGTTTTDKNGSTLTYSYDGLNRLIGKSSSADTSDTYAYAYNKKGLRTAMTGGGVNASYIYDGIGRLTKETLTDGTVKEYNYDMNGNRAGFKLTKNNAVQYTLTYTYDKMNQLTKVSENGTTKAEYTYNDDGTLKKSTYGGRTTEYTYNLANLLTEVNNAKGTTQISKYNYTYYLDGNQKSKSESVSGTSKGTTSYTYDGLNRLIKEQAPDNTYNYQYDAYGNRSQLSVTGDETYTTAYTYDKNNRLRKQTKTAGAASEITDYWYDPNGNQISSMTASTGTSDAPEVGIQPAGQLMDTVNEYDSWNQLTKTMQGRKTTSYTYNGDGLRMSKNVGGTTTRHIWDGTNIAADVTNGAVTKYIRGLQLISSKKGSTESFYNYNGHGDVVQLTNSSGSITKQYGYDAFGNEMNKVYSDTNPFRYCGEYYDKENYSIYLRARYYSPVTGRFITEDPIKDGLNWYAYCANEPVNAWDSNGLAKHTQLEVKYQNLCGKFIFLCEYKMDYENADSQQQRENAKQNADNMRNAILNESLLNEDTEQSRQLKAFVRDVINFTDGGSITQVSALIPVVTQYLNYYGPTVVVNDNTNFYGVYYNIWSEYSKQQNILYMIQTEYIQDKVFRDIVHKYLGVDISESSIDLNRYSKNGRSVIEYDRICTGEEVIYTLPQMPKFD